MATDKCKGGVLPVSSDGSGKMDTSLEIHDVKTKTTFTKSGDRVRFKIDVKLEVFLAETSANIDVLDDKAMATTFGKLTTWNLGFIRFLDDATRLKLFYEINNEEKNSVSNNGLRVEMITVF
jgi:hypothetical protein